MGASRKHSFRSSGYVFSWHYVTRLDTNFENHRILNAVFSIWDLQEIEPKKKSSAQRNALASALRLQRKIIKTLNESIDDLSSKRKSLWWSRWIPREEWMKLVNVYKIVLVPCPYTLLNTFHSHFTM